jgi:hypothetical protein
MTDELMSLKEITNTRFAINECELRSSIILDGQRLNLLFATACAAHEWKAKFEECREAEGNASDALALLEKTITKNKEAFGDALTAAFNEGGKLLEENEKLREELKTLTSVSIQTSTEVALLWEANKLKEQLRLEAELNIVSVSTNQKLIEQLRVARALLKEIYELADKETLWARKVKMALENAE